MIRLSHICASYPDKKVIENLSLTFPDTGAFALMAPSGFGKTTLLRVLAGLKTISAGEITGLENKKISFLFQEDRLLPWLTAQKNVELASNPEKAKHWLSQMEIPDGSQMPREMSGGMQRRAALARAMAFGGDILLLDEPFKGLDEALRERIAGRMKEIFPLTVLSVHDAVETDLMDAKIIRLDQ
ncbi:MAG: ATP-binding cassette domain-containing protein [Clostridia bacterium]|nr:ATP-binding cassette domain-containing protein [Clostridia bacterium]